MAVKNTSYALNSDGIQTKRSMAGHTVLASSSVRKALVSVREWILPGNHGAICNSEKAMAVGIYLGSVTLMLIVTAAGKIFMAFGGAEVLDSASPLFSNISNRYLLLMTACLESAVAVLVLSRWGGQRLPLRRLLGWVPFF